MQDRESRLEADVARLTQQRDDERAEKQELTTRLNTLREILTDPQNQLERTAIGYIYRLDLETMHRVADALGFVRVMPQPALAFCILEELPLLIRPD